MKKLILPTLALLGGCDGTPLAPDRQPAFKASSTVTVFARTQDVTLRFSSGETAQASFKARFYASTSPDPEAQIDGAILVVSAADGPMPQIGGEALAIEILRATVNRAGVVQFEGTATVSTGREVSDQSPITGSVRPSNGDPISWAILGGNVYDWEIEFGAKGNVLEIKEVWVTISD
jgi:hypothetical protein